MTAYIYILLCSDNHYYVGTTRGSLEKRINERNNGTYSGYTKSRRPVKLMFSESFENIVDAITMERRLKGWSRAKKEALIRGDYKELIRLAKPGSKKSFDTRALLAAQDKEVL